MTAGYTIGTRLTHLHRVDSSTTTLWTSLLPVVGWCLVSFYGVNPDHMPHTATSDPGLHCLPIAPLWGS